MREARNPQGSTPLFRGAPVVRLDTCAHGARLRQPENLMRFHLQPTDGSPQALAAAGPTVFGVPGTMDILVRRHPVHNLCVVRPKNLTQDHQTSTHNVPNAGFARNPREILRCIIILTEALIG